MRICFGPRSLGNWLRTIVLLCTMAIDVSVFGQQDDRWSEQPLVSVPNRERGSEGVEDRDTFVVAPGFVVEQLFVVPKDTHGSWVSMTFDPQGRLIVSDQGDRGLFRVTPPAIGSDQATRVERLTIPITAAQGLLCAFDSLYVSVNGGPGSGLYRLSDTSGDDQYDEMVKLKDLRGGGEHGPHALRLSPDGKSIYLVAGNHTDPPEDFQASRLLPNWQEDLLLPRQWDARGHARGRLAPGGWIAATDPEGKHWEMISIGYRNTYDIVFNADGELFAYDADMEWDLGAPWYRPTRLVHATSGSEFGWRSGTGKWPTYFPDTLPPVIDIGPGSPVGVTSGVGARFPEKYQRAIYLLDWTFGTIYAIHLKPQGASYAGEKEEFVSRVALPLTDAEIGPDGAMYFTVGGRGTQSVLYRVRYVGEESTDLIDGAFVEGRAARQLRHSLEQHHHADGDPRSLTDAEVEQLWKELGNSDHFVRYAARVALERVPRERWASFAARESDPVRVVQAVVAIARAGIATTDGEDAERAALKVRALEMLSHVDLNAVSLETQRDWLRAVALVSMRLGRPTVQESHDLVAKIDPLFPAQDDSLNRELARVMVYLNAPSVVQKSLALMERDETQSAEEIADLLARNRGYGDTIARMLANQPEQQKLFLAFVLRNVRYGWSLEERRAYFDWLNQASQKSGGESYRGFIENIRKDALANMSESELAALESDVVAPPPKDSELPKPIGPGRAWTEETLRSLTQSGLRGRDFERGKTAFRAARCIVCHRFDGEGGSTGPDLTNVAGRFQISDLIDSLAQPSRVISDQYRASIIETRDGRLLTGRIVNDDGQTYTVQIHPEDATQIAEIARTDVVGLQPSDVSLMPAQLLDPLSEAEVLNLMAYLLSRGNPNDLMFQTQASAIGQ